MVSQPGASEVFTDVRNDIYLGALKHEVHCSDSIITSQQPKFSSSSIIGTVIPNLYKPLDVSFTFVETFPLFVSTQSPITKVWFSFPDFFYLLVASGSGPHINIRFVEGKGFVTDTELSELKELKLLKKDWGKDLGKLYLFYVDEGKLKYVVGSPKYLDPYVELVGRYMGTIVDHGTILNNVDESFRVDSVVKVGNDNIYVFCSDRSRCLLIVAHINRFNILLVDGIALESFGPDLSAIDWDADLTAEARQTLIFSICQLNYGKYCNIASELFREGLDALYKPNIQSDPIPDLDFRTQYEPLDSNKLICYPSSTFEFDGPNKIYNWELFFHIPHFIAYSLNQNRKFEAARKWYHYIFDPFYTGSSGNLTGPSAEWNFAPFRDGVIDQLSRYLQDPEDATVWVKNPYSPHALARVRPGTYQKAIVLSYVENLLDWADQEFSRDTRESVNRAHGYYNTAKRLLKLSEIEHPESCQSLMTNIESIIRRAVPRERFSELMDKLTEIKDLQPGRIKSLHTKVQSIYDSNYSADVKADVLISFLGGLVQEARDLPRSTLDEIITAKEDEIDAIMVAVEDNAEDMILSLPSTGSCACVPPSWRIVTPEALPKIRLLTSSLVGCIPENPIFQTYLNNITSKLKKIHTGRNITGIKRVLSIYEAAIDPMILVKAVGRGGGLDALNFIGDASVGPYRFSYLVEKAKSLARQVMDTGNALLLAIEKKESEELTYQRARHGIKLAKAKVFLTKLGVVQAEDGLELAVKQTEKAIFQQTLLDGLMKANLNKYEDKAIDNFNQSKLFMQVAKGFHIAAATAAMMPGPTLGFEAATMIVKTISQPSPSVAGSLSSVAASLSTQAGIEATKASIAQINASFERRKQEWEYQKSLSIEDQKISEQNEVIANDLILITQQEMLMAEMEAEYAEQTLEFLREKFTNKELYSWMVKTLSKILYGFYNLAYTTARMAQATMEFERNERLDFISFEYWDSEKKGLLSGDKLLLDINNMDSAYIQGNGSSSLRLSSPTVNPMYIESKTRAARKAIRRLISKFRKYSIGLLTVVGNLFL